MQTKCCNSSIRVNIEIIGRNLTNIKDRGKGLLSKNTMWTE